MNKTGVKGFELFFVFTDFIVQILKIVKFTLLAFLLVMVCYCGIQIKINDNKIQINGLNPKADMIKVHATGLGFNEKVFRLEVSGGF